LVEYPKGGYIHLKSKYGIFFQKCFNYKFNLFNPYETPWEGTRVSKKKNLKSIDFMRQKVKSKNLNYKFYRIDKEKNIELFTDGGWHFNNIMSPELISLKLRTFAHTEYSRDTFSSPNVIKKKIEDNEKKESETAAVTSSNNNINDNNLNNINNHNKIILPYYGNIIDSNCKGLVYNHGLYTQCTEKSKNLCGKCVKNKYGTVEDRKKYEIGKYIAPNGKKEIDYNVLLNRLKYNIKDVIKEESIPPLRKAPIGTSDIICVLTEFFKILSSSVIELSSIFFCSF